MNNKNNNVVISTKKFKCDKCGKSFDSPQAKTMHNMRVHTRAGKAGWQKAIAVAARRKARATIADKTVPAKTWRDNVSEGMRRSWAKRKGQSLTIQSSISPEERERRLAERRIYQKQLRERYFREGRNSKGQLMPPGWKPRGKRGAYKKITTILAEPIAEKKETLTRLVNHCPTCGIDIAELEQFLKARAKARANKNPVPQPTSSRWHIA